MAGLLSSTPDARPMCSATARHAVIGFQHDRAPRPSCSSSGARAQDGCGRGCMRGTIAAASPPRDGVAMASDQQTIFKYTQVELDTKPGIALFNITTIPLAHFPTRPAGIALFNITPTIRQAIAEAGVREGFVHVVSRHTTTALTINEDEPRLVDDVRQFLARLAPPTMPYLHNDLHMREAPEGWPGGWEAWAKQEPANAHSHLLSMVLGNTETIPVHEGKLTLGTWQSVLLVELDGPRRRTVGIQVVGHK